MTAKRVRNFWGPSSNSAVPPRHCEKRGWGSDEAILAETFAGLLRGVTGLLGAELTTGSILRRALAMTAKTGAALLWYSRDMWVVMKLMPAIQTILIISASKHQDSA
jgi:hypothetical protein